MKKALYLMSVIFFTSISGFGDSISEKISRVKELSVFAIDQGLDTGANCLDLGQAKMAAFVLNELDPNVKFDGASLDDIIKKLETNSESCQ